MGLLFSGAWVWLGHTHFFVGGSVMNLNFEFFFFSISIGIALAMDAFSVSLANGLNEPKMSKLKMCGVAGLFAFFQAFMPLTGWVCIKTVLSCFQAFEKLIPWIALALLGFIGGKMLVEGIKNKEGEDEKLPVGFWALVVQGIATSIDALSVGFVIAEYSALEAIVSAIIIAALTFVICLAGVKIGNIVGCRFAGKASIFGGAILIIIGLEILIASFLG